MAAYGGPLMELIRLPSAHRIFFRASVYEASPGARFARATGRRITGVTIISQIVSTSFFLVVYLGLKLNDAFDIKL